MAGRGLSTIETAAEFPVDPGAVVKVTCSDSGALNKGNNEVTCTAGTVFTFFKEPSCLRPGKFKSRIIQTLYVYIL